MFNINKLTKNQLIEKCKELNIKYSKSDKKQVLIDLLTQKPKAKIADNSIEDYIKKLTNIDDHEYILEYHKQFLPSIIEQDTSIIIPLELTIENFMYYNTHKTFKFNGINTIIGENASGKTTVLNALLYILTDFKLTAIQAINNKSSNFNIKFRFKIGNDEYLAEKYSIGKKTVVIRYEKNGKNIDNIPIDNKFNILNSFVTKICELSDNERCRLFKNCFNLEYLDKMHSHIKTDIATFESSINQLEGQIMELSKMMQGIHINSLLLEKRELEIQKDTVNLMKSEIEILQDKLGTLYYDPKLPKSAELPEGIYFDKEYNLTDLELEFDELQKDKFYDFIDEPEPENAPEPIKPQEYNRENIIKCEKYSKRLEQIREKCVKPDEYGDLTEMMDRVRKYNNVETIIQLVEKVYKYKNDIRLSKEHEKYNKELRMFLIKQGWISKRRKDRLIELENKISYEKLRQIHIKQYDILLNNKNKDEIKNIKEQIRDLNKKINLINLSRIDIINNELSKFDKYRLEYNEKTLEYYNKIVELKKRKQYKSLMDNKNIPQMMLNERLNILASNINKFINPFVNFEISFDDKGTILVNGLNTLQCSGYERMIIDLGLKVGLYQIYKGQHIELFFIDEALDCVDNNNYLKIGKLLECIKDIYKNVYVITHRKLIQTKC